MCTHRIMCTNIITIYFPDVMCIHLILSSKFKAKIVVINLMMSLAASRKKSKCNNEDDDDDEDPGK